MTEEMLKVTIWGPGGVGKTALCLRFERDCWDDYYDPYYYAEDSHSTVEVFEIAGQEEYRELTDLWIRKADVILLVYSITSRSSFEELEFRRERIQRAKDDDSPMMFLVGNKCDREDERQVSLEEGKQLAELWNVGFLETSAYTRINVFEAFDEIVRLARRKKFPANSEKAVIPALPIPEFSSEFRLNIRYLVDSKLDHDALLISDDFEKFKLLYLAVTTMSSHWMPTELLEIILDFMKIHGFFSTRYELCCHKCIMLSRFPTLMAFIREDKIQLALPQMYNRNALKEVVYWIYSGQIQDQRLLKEMLPIAQKLKLYNLVAICEGKAAAHNSSNYGFPLLLNAEAFSDVQFTTSDGKTIFGHKVILRCRSQFFSSLIYNNPKDNIPLSENFELNMAIFRYIYEDDIGTLSLPELLDLLKLVDKRQSSDSLLLKQIQIRICERVSYETFGAIWDTCSAAKNADYLKVFSRRWVGYRVDIFRKKYPELWEDIPSATRAELIKSKFPGIWRENEKEDAKCLIS
jgi:GTPase KRas protein